MVSLVGSLPASLNASRMEKNGTASASKTATAAVPHNHGRRCTVRLHRYQNPWPAVGARTSRPGTWRRSMLRPTKPSMAGQQRQGRGQDHEHGGDRSDRQAVHEGQAHHEEAEQGDDHRAAGEQHGPARRGQGHDGGLPWIPPLVETLPVPGDDEKGVVDAHSESDHGHQLRPEASAP